MNDKYDEYAKDNENDEDNDDVKDIASPDLSLCIARHFLLPSPTVRQSRAQPGTFSPTCTSLGVQSRTGLGVLVPCIPRDTFEYQEIQGTTSLLLSLPA